MKLTQKWQKTELVDKEIKSYHNYIIYVQEARQKTDTLNRDMKDIIKDPSQKSREKNLQCLNEKLVGIKRLK